MKKLTIFILLLIPMVVSVLFEGLTFAQEYIQFTLIRRPHYDRLGRVADSGYGGGKIYPNGIHPGIDLNKITGEYQRGDIIILRLDILPCEALEIINENGEFGIVKTYKVRQRRKERRVYPVKSAHYNFSQFNPQILTETEANEILTAWGFSAESCVTCEP